MPVSRYQEHSAIYQKATIANANGTTVVSTSPNQDLQYRVDAAYAVSTCTTDRYVEVQVNSGAIVYVLGCVLVPAMSGVDAVPPVDLIAALIKSPNDGVVMQALATVKFRVTVAVETGTTIVVSLVGGLI